MKHRAELHEAFRFAVQAIQISRRFSASWALFFAVCLRRIRGDATSFLAPFRTHSPLISLLCTAVSRAVSERLARACSGRVKPSATTCVETGSKVVANLVRTLLRSPRCTAHHQLMGSSDAHAQEHDSYWHRGGPFDTSIRRDDERRCGRQS